MGTSPIWAHFVFYFLDGSMPDFEFHQVIVSLVGFVDVVFLLFVVILIGWDGESMVGVDNAEAP